MSFGLTTVSTVYHVLYDTHTDKIIDFYDQYNYYEEATRGNLTSEEILAYLESDDYTNDHNALLNAIDTQYQAYTQHQNETNAPRG